MGENLVLPVSLQKQWVTEQTSKTPGEIKEGQKMARAQCDEQECQDEHLEESGQSGKQQIGESYQGRTSSFGWVRAKTGCLC